MHNFLKNMIAIFVCLSGMPFLIREWMCQHRVAILLYHDPKPTVFAKHIAHLSHHYTVISLDTLVTAIHRKDTSQMGEFFILGKID